MRDEAQPAADIEELMWVVDRNSRHETRRQAAAIERRWRREQRAPEVRLRRRLAVLLPLLALTVTANVASLGPFGMPQHSPSVAETTRNVEVAVRLGVSLVEIHKREQGVLPVDLDSIGLDASHGWTYSAFDGRFQLGLSHRGQQGSYDSDTGRIVVAPAGGPR